MKASIETINGKKMTVVWYDEYYHNKPFEAITCDDYINDVNMADGSVTFIDSGSDTHIATALPALPKHPKPEDAALLYRYMAEGLHIEGSSLDDSDVDGVARVTAEPFSTYETHPRDICEELGDICEPEITRATDSEGNKIEVAIEEGSDDNNNRDN